MILKIVMYKETLEGKSQELILEADSFLISPAQKIKISEDEKRIIESESIDYIACSDPIFKDEQFWTVVHNDIKYLFQTAYLTEKGDTRQRYGFNKDKVGYEKLIKDFKKQAKSCKFTDELGHKLENNIHYINLDKK